MDRDYLGLTPKDSSSKAKAKAAELTREEVNELVGDLHGEARKAKARSGGNLLTGLLGGFVIGDIVSYGFKAYGASSLPFADWVRAGYPGLRVVPHGLLAALFLYLGRDLESRRHVIEFAGGLGLGVSALARLRDWFEHDGDLSQDKEAVLLARVAELESQVKKQ